MSKAAQNKGEAFAERLAEGRRVVGRTDPFACCCPYASAHPGTGHNPVPA